jgi:group I intron endonuclease
MIINKDDIYRNRSGIYLIKNTRSGGTYVGSASNLRMRHGMHHKHLSENRHSNAHLQRSWNKYGGDCFSFSVLEVVLDRSQLIEREQYWMDQLKPAYNIAPRAESCLGLKQSPEACAKRSIALKGRKRTPEQCRRISESRKGGQLGKRLSQEIKDKIAVKLKRNKNGCGHKISPEHRAKLNASRVYTPEYRAKLSERRKEWWMRKWAYHYLAA